MYSWRRFMSLLCRSFSISSNPVFQSLGFFLSLSKKAVAYTFNVKCSVIVFLQRSQTFRAFTQAFDPLWIDVHEWVRGMDLISFLYMLSSNFSSTYFGEDFLKSILTSKSNPGSYSCEHLLVGSLFYFVCLHFCFCPRTCTLFCYYVSVIIVQDQVQRCL